MNFSIWDNERKQKIDIETIGQSGENYSAHCPREENHKNGDRKPSLSVHPVNGYNCHACGFKGAIYKPDKFRRSTNKVIVAYYDYRNADGKLIFQKIRFQPKDFRLRRPNIDNADNLNPAHWTYNISSVENILYKLPDVLKTETVYLVEGEKDADKLISYGLTATTSPFGGGKGKNKWKPEYNAQLTGKHVILIPDNDQPGIDFMQYAGNQLLGKAASVSWLDLPGVPVKGDISDYFEQGATVEDFKALQPSIFTLPIQSVIDAILKPEKEEDDTITTKSIVPGLIHWTRNDKDEIKYLFEDNNALKVCPTFDNHRPKPNMAKFIFTLPHESIITRKYDPNTALLLADIIAFIRDFVELPEDKYYLIPALWVLHSYLMEKQNTSPIMYFHGLKASGKTRAGKVLAELAFRAYFLTSPREASMFRIPEAFEPTMFIDEIKILGKDGNVEVGDILKTRYERGCSVPRIDTSVKSDNDEDKIKPYSTFGATVITTSEILGEYLDSRSIEFLMQQNSDDRKDVERPIDKDRAATLRERLLYFRCQWLKQTFPTFESVARRRDGQLFNPLFQMLVIADNTTERITEFKEFMAKDAISKKQLESDTKQAETFEKILKYMVEKGSKEFYAKDMLVDLNRGKENDPYKMTKNSLGRMLHAMGFKQPPGGKRLWTIEDKTINSLCDRFGLDNPEITTLPF